MEVLFERVDALLAIASPELGQLRAERDALKAAEKRVKALCEQAQAKNKFSFDVTGQPFPATVRAADVLAALAAPESHEDAPLDRFTAGLRMIARAVADAKSATRQDLVLTGPETTPDAPTEETDG
jgi:hypothetical protein